MRSNGSDPGVIAHGGRAVGVAAGVIGVATAGVGLAGCCGAVGDAAGGAVGVPAAIPGVGDAVECVSDSLQPALQSRPTSTLDTNHLHPLIRCLRCAAARCGQAHDPRVGVRYA